MPTTLLADTGAATMIVVAVIYAVPATLAAVLSWRNGRRLRTPSGDTIGSVAERTHALAATTTAHAKAISDQLETLEPPKPPHIPGMATGRPGE